MAPKKTKVLVVTSSFPKYEGDSDGIFVFELASRLQSEFEVTVLAPMFKGGKKEATVGNLRVCRHKQFFIDSIELAYGSGMVPNLARNPLLMFVIPFFLVYQFLAIKKICSEQKVRVIHAHWMIPQGFLAVLYKKMLFPGVKVVVTIHGSDINKFNHWLGNGLKRFVLNNLDKLTVVSQAIKDRLPDLGYSGDAYVYPMGVDTNRFSPQKANLKVKTHNDVDGPLILYVGRLIQQKGIVDLVKAMPMVLKSIPNAKLMVIGDGNLKDELVTLSATLGCSDSVILMGFIAHNELPPYFATADVFVLPSYSEGFGLVYAEALSSGTLTIASDLPTVRAIIEDKKTGFVLKHHKVSEIEKKIIEVLMAKDELEELKKRGREYVVHNFDWSIVAANYSNLLRVL